MTSDTTTGRERRQAIVTAHLDAENNRDVDATLATFHHPRYWINGETFDGAAAVRDQVHALMTGFPDLHAEPLTLRHADDAVIGEARVTGTHTGPFAGIPPTGRRIDLPVVAIFEFDEDRLVGEKVSYDGATLMRQLGVLPDLAVTAPGDGNST